MLLQGSVAMSVSMLADSIAMCWQTCCSDSIAVLVATVAYHAVLVGGSLAYQMLPASPRP
jgi:hypothetical protein